MYGFTESFNLSVACGLMLQVRRRAQTVANEVKCACALLRVQVGAFFRAFTHTFSPLYHLPSLASTSIDVFFFSLHLPHAIVFILRRAPQRLFDVCPEARGDLSEQEKASLRAEWFRELANNPTAR
jgi:hypothetical protein